MRGLELAEGLLEHLYVGAEGLGGFEPREHVHRDLAELALVEKIEHRAEDLEHGRAYR